MDDLSTVNVPPDLADKFTKQDEEYLAGGSSDLSTLQDKETS